MQIKEFRNRRREEEKRRGEGRRKGQNLFSNAFSSHAPGAYPGLLQYRLTLTL